MTFTSANSKSRFMLATSTETNYPFQKTVRIIIPAIDPPLHSIDAKNATHGGLPQLQTQSSMKMTFTSAKSESRFMLATSTETNYPFQKTARIIIPAIDPPLHSIDAKKATHGVLPQLQTQAGMKCSGRPSLFSL
ncbi:hypothetical protein CDAR_247501 [Caerostris darwini]|uniref:Uncharacterized protein n=1 Tax=Caerostris darwini TaxID=1538125 RepID=A0AAV4R9B2_9ARAC|nr:hypothetical protein CDAR_247501 [Caerostris darwini]